ncbi:MAG: response regulator transcription factor [Chloroflexi bacterium]|nr:response regulator transcription factor [Chloroflexota bacterium]
MTKKILVVDDEPKILQVVTGYLEQAGFQVVTARDGPTALSIFRHEKPDLVILDLMLPGMDGLDVCQIIRRESGVPIIMLTARAEEVDRLIGLEMGADDYVVKPFSPREVVARVRAVLRRAAGEIAPPEILRAGDIVIDLARHTVEVAGKAVDLTPTEFDLLVALARYPGRTFTRLQLLEQIQGSAYDGYERTVDAHIKNLRAKIEPNPKQPRYIVTVYGVGYKLEENPGAK